MAKSGSDREQLTLLQESTEIGRRRQQQIERDEDETTASLIPLVIIFIGKASYGKRA